tara:strand:+ start:1175 stop:1390 length:216 start_codon:yes stop_codon:yes gene_type:complete
MDIIDITEKEEIECGRQIVELMIMKKDQRRDYMKNYYKERKRNGFIKTVKKKDKQLDCLIIERGNFIVDFK